jgi:hypothetical protein
MESDEQCKRETMNVKGLHRVDEREKSQCYDRGGSRGQKYCHQGTKWKGRDVRIKTR